MAAYDNLPVYKTGYDLLLDVFRMNNNLTRLYKHSLGEKLRNELTELLVIIYRANVNEHEKESNFKNRVVHHLMFNRVNPICDRKLIRDCYSCHKGFGTGDGVERLQRHIRSVTDNYTREAFVLKLDIQGYFMSINRNILWNKVAGILSKANNKGECKRYDETLFLMQE